MLERNGKGTPKRRWGKSSTARTSGIMTSEGLIESIPVIINGVKVMAPICIVPNVISESNHYPIPMKDNDGNYLYALPGGGKITAGGLFNGS